MPEPKPSPGEELVRVKSGGLNFAFCDGSVHQISRNVDMLFVLPALATIAGGETIPADAIH